MKCYSSGMHNIGFHQYLQTHISKKNISFHVYKCIFSRKIFFFFFLHFRAKSSTSTKYCDCFWERTSTLNFGCSITDFCQQLISKLISETENGQSRDGNWKPVSVENWLQLPGRININGISPYQCFPLCPACHANQE